MMYEYTCFSIKPYITISPSSVGFVQHGIIYIQIGKLFSIKKKLSLLTIITIHKKAHACKQVSKKQFHRGFRDGKNIIR